MLSLPFLLFLFALLCWGLSSQLANPSGWFGRRFMANLLNRENRSLLDAAVQALDPKPGERILDAGFGGGYALERIAALTFPATPVGIDISEAMIVEADRRWSGRIEVHRADAAALPFDNASFDGIVSVNTIYFWKDPAAAFLEMGRVLKASGRFVLAGRSKAMLRISPVTWFRFRLYTERELHELLAAAGFSVEFRHPSAAEWIAVIRPRRRIA